MHEKNVEVRFLKDGNANGRVYLAGDTAFIPESDARMMAQKADATGIFTREPICEIVS